MLLNVDECCKSVLCTKLCHRRFSIRLFRCVASQVPTLVLVSQEITKLDNKFSVRLFTGDHNFTRIIQLSFWLESLQLDFIMCKVLAVCKGGYEFLMLKGPQ